MTSSRRVYLDHNATTPLRPEVLETMLPFLRDDFGNASSIHWGGRKVRAAVEEARENVALLVNCHPSEVVFTSGGTEADNTALKGTVAAAPSGSHIVTTAVEHPAVLNSCLWLESRGTRVTRLPVDGEGRLDLERLRQAAAGETLLVSVMLANNETGVLFPVEQVGEIAAESGVYFHCDAVQGAARVRVDCRAANISLLSLSAHKLGGPKGVGALVVRRGVKLQPLIHGGSQERNRRGGTENVAAIAGFGRACQLALASLDTEPQRLLLLRDRLEEGLRSAIPATRINGEGADRLPNTLNVSFPGVRSDSLLMNLDLQGVAASSGSACSSGTLRHSPVLAAMGIGAETAGASVRFSLGSGNTNADIDYVLTVLPALVARLREKKEKL